MRNFWVCSSLFLSFSFGRTIGLIVRCISLEARTVSLLYEVRDENSEAQGQNKTDNCWRQEENLSQAMFFHRTHAIADSEIWTRATPKNDAEPAEQNITLCFHVRSSALNFRKFPNASAAACLLRTRHLPRPFSQRPLLLPALLSSGRFLPHSCIHLLTLQHVFSLLRRTGVNAGLARFL